MKENRWSADRAQMTDLEYFMQMQNHVAPDALEHTAELWDQRAKDWAKLEQRSGKMKTQDRVHETIQYLAGYGLLGPDCDVADVGCGPGKFAVAFAKTARSVWGIDISGTMIAQAKNRALQERQGNVAFAVCDFKMLDIPKANLENKFDLVFSSITPAAHGMAALEKSMQMSRNYCCNITHVHSENTLEQQIMKDVFQRNRPMLRDGHWFYSLFNVLFLMGYYPEVSYYKQHQVHEIHPDDNYAQRFLRHMLSPQERTLENEKRIVQWLKAYRDTHGTVTEMQDVWFGRVLWNVNEKTARKSY